MFIANYGLNILYLGLYCLVLSKSYDKMYTLLDHIDKNSKLSKTLKLYIAKNIIKSIVLLLLTLYSPIVIYNIYQSQHWNNQLMNHIGSIYVSNDIIGFIRVKRIHLTTKIHHIMTTTILLYSFTIDFNTNIIGQLIFIYCMLSCYSFMVNFYLGIRFFKDHRIVKVYLEHLRIMALIIYVGSCGINWIAQLYIMVYAMLNQGIMYKLFIYSSLLIPIIIDDIKLIKWLSEKKNVKV